jgi:pyruvate dehydrogenase E1 component alpha subunit
MVKKIIRKFSVEYMQILDESGKCDEKLMPRLSNNDIKKIYGAMLLTRTFDKKAINLQRQGRLGTYASVKGQEATQVIASLLFKKEDFVFPAFREHGVFLSLGFSPTMLFQSWGGDERGMKVPKEMNIFPVSIPVGSHPLHAVGAAMAFNYQKKKSVAITYFGDGATSEGDFHEAMNFAGEFNAPVVFICQNNQYAISVPVKEQTASKTLAQKAFAYGFEGIQVDGNDVFAVYLAVSEAMKKARSGNGPTFIECFTYRLGDHTTSDDASKYRLKSEVSDWGKKDPILRLEKHMIKKRIANEKYFDDIKNKAKGIISNAVEEYEKIKPAPIEDIFNYQFASLTDNLKEQLEKLKREVK